MEENNELIYVDYGNLLGQNCIIIHYNSGYFNAGKMLVLGAYYKKAANKFKKAFKDCEITKFIECILTEEILLKEYISYEAKRVYGS